MPATHSGRPERPKTGQARIWCLHAHSVTTSPWKFGELPHCANRKPRRSTVLTTYTYTSPRGAVRSAPASCSRVRSSCACSWPESGKGWRSDGTRAGSCPTATAFTVPAHDPPSQTGGVLTDGRHTCRLVVSSGPSGATGANERDRARRQDACAEMRGAIRLLARTRRPADEFERVSQRDARSRIELVPVDQLPDGKQAAP